VRVKYDKFCSRFSQFVDIGDDKHDFEFESFLVLILEKSLCFATTQFVEYSLITADVGDEDISANFDIYCDDSLSVPIAKNTTSSKTPLVFPREKDQPKEWPEIVGGLFIVAAIGFFWMTAFKNYRKRKDYQQLPITMNL
jgi:hypothetical protein